MPNPNNVLKYASRKLILVIEIGFTDKNIAEKEKEELKATGKFHMVKVSSYRIGPRNRRTYNYTVRAYNKPEKN